VLFPEEGLAEGEWRSTIKPQVVLGTLARWSHKYGVQVQFGGKPKDCERYAFSWLAHWWRLQQDQS
jgi:hypothetical protein